MQVRKVETQSRQSPAGMEHFYRHLWKLGKNENKLKVTPFSVAFSEAVPKYTLLRPIFPRRGEIAHLFTFFIFKAKIIKNTLCCAQFFLEEEKLRICSHFLIFQLRFGLKKQN